MRPRSREIAPQSPDREGAYADMFGFCDTRYSSYLGKRSCSCTSPRAFWGCPGRPEWPPETRVVAQKLDIRRRTSV
eukprot:2295204-Pyramimonas_sp.AAC.1